jgi:hypothetical protein
VTRDARKIYNSLSKYFGLRARDTFLNPLQPDRFDSAATNNTLKDRFLEEIFGQGTSYKTNAAIKSMFQQGGKDLQKDFCVTSYSGQEFIDIDHSDYNPADQGFNPKNESNPGKFSLNDFSKEPETQFTAAVYQIFPIATGLDVMDADIASLFLSSIRTLTMSQAVPYIEIKILSSDLGSDPDENEKGSRTRELSLGRFLMGPRDTDQPDAMSANFVTADKNVGYKNQPISAVAANEIFTTPQTMIGKSEKYYSREVGGPVDKFRPFMALKSLKIDDIPTGAGTISYKTADLSLTLFDKGRLEDIISFVTPRRDANIRFEITYGWSHPAGKKVSRKSDSDFQNRLGVLIDSMKTTEIFSMVKNSYNFAEDGTLDIDINLATAGKTALSSRTISRLSLNQSDRIKGVSMTLAELQKQLDSIKTTILNKGGLSNAKIQLPVFIQAPSAQNMITLDPDSVKELQKFSNKLSATKNQDLKNAAVQLYNIFTNKKGKNSVFKSIQVSREETATNFIKHLATTPDPFLRGEYREKRSNSQENKYVSYGKLLSYVLIDTLKEDSIDLQLVFSSFNQNAAGVYDFNIAQFPIPLYVEKNGSKFIPGGLDELLKRELKRTPVLTINSFVKFVSDNFLTFHGSGAYGLSQIFKLDQRTKNGQGAPAKAIKKLRESDNAASKIRIQEIERNNLSAIYQGKRREPLFQCPRVDMRITTKRSNLTNNTANSSKAGQTVVRIHFQDKSAGRLMSSADTLIQLTRKGYFTDEDYSGRNPSARGPRHNELYQKNKSELQKRGFIKKDPTISQKIVEELKKNIQPPTEATSASIEAAKKAIDEKLILQKPKSSIRKFFFENSPYLLHGTEGSGIISADLSSETDDQLSSMYFAQQFSGKGDSTAADRITELPMQVNPASLSITTFGCPFLSLHQRYFVDFATNTSMDNYYICTSISHEISDEQYTTTAEMKPYDIWGIYANALNSLEDILFAGAKAEIDKKKKTRKKK